MHSIILATCALNVAEVPESISYAPHVNAVVWKSSQTSWSVN